MTHVTSRTGMDETPAPVSRGKDSVPALWREWRAIVNAVARGKSVPWKQPEYSALYKALLDELRADADSPPHPQSELRARLAMVVEPWLRLRAITDLDPPTLIELSQTCRRLDAELRPARHISFKTWFVSFCLLAVGAFLFASYLLHGVK